METLRAQKVICPLFTPCGVEMAKWGLACDVACHPTKRVKVATRGNDVKNELICDLASRKEFLEAHNVSSSEPTGSD
jgi:hypothetical protein